MFYSLLMILSAFAYACNFAVTKVYQLEKGNGPKAGVVFNCICGLLGAVLYFAFGGFKCDVTAYSLIMAFLMTLLSGTYTMIGFKIMSMGNMTIYIQDICLFCRFNTIYVKVLHLQQFYFCA